MPADRTYTLLEELAPERHLFTATIHKVHQGMLDMGYPKNQLYLKTNKGGTIWEKQKD